MNPFRMDLQKLGFVFVLGLSAFVAAVAFPDFPLRGLLMAAGAVLLVKAGVPLGFHLWAAHRAAQLRRDRALAEARMRAYYRAAGLPWLESEEGMNDEH